jgi:hypothetical protein
MPIPLLPFPLLLQYVALLHKTTARIRLASARREVLTTPHYNNV